jgi:CheY-like chemotaxis protein
MFMQPVYRSSAIEILLIEDNEGDIELMREAFHDGKILNRIHVARDGEEGLDFLYRRGQYADAIRPDIVLLDLNTPRKSGREVLAEIKRDSDLQEIPVVVLSSCAAEQDILRSYNLHANSYIIKPVDVTQFLQVIETIESFWLSVVRLPPASRQAA